MYSGVCNGAVVRSMRNLSKSSSASISTMHPELENESPEVMQHVLRKYENNNNLLVTSCNSVMGTRMGDNYMSVVKRVKVQGKINGHDGEFEYIYYYIFDCIPMGMRSTKSKKVFDNGKKKSKWTPVTFEIQNLSMRKRSNGYFFFKNVSTRTNRQIYLCISK